MMSIMALRGLADDDTGRAERLPTLVLRPVGGEGTGLAIALDAPISLAEARFGVTSVVLGYHPLWRRRVSGIFASVTDPERARRAFEAWGVVRPLP
jgi:hypothetical protein